MIFTDRIIYQVIHTFLKSRFEFSFFYLDDMMYKVCYKCLFFSFMIINTVPVLFVNLNIKHVLLHCRPCYMVKSIAELFKLSFTAHRHCKCDFPTLLVDEDRRCLAPCIISDTMFRKLAG